MKTLIKNIFVITFFLGQSFVFAQQPTDPNQPQDPQGGGQQTAPQGGGVLTAPPLNGIYEKIHQPNKKPIPYASLREADVMWAKRIWRQVDLREKINLPLYYPETPRNNKISLTTMLWNAVTIEGTLRAYNDEDFQQLMTAQEVIAANNRVDTQTIANPTNPDVDTTIIIRNEFESKNVKKFLVKEDWFFERQRSVMDVRIVGICPVVEQFTVDPATGEKMFKGLKTIFWVYFPECRPLFAKNDVFNRQNDAERRSFDDIFWKRMFGSVIYREENVYDRQIADYAPGFDALLEAERIKQEVLFRYEHDLWEF